MSGKYISESKFKICFYVIGAPRVKTDSRVSGSPLGMYNNLLIYYGDTRPFCQLSKVLLLLILFTNRKISVQIRIIMILHKVTSIMLA